VHRLGDTGDTDMGVNSKVVETAYAAFGRGDIPAIIEMLSDDVDWRSPETLPHGGAFQGKGGVMKFFEGIGAAWDTDFGIDIDIVDDLGADAGIGVVRGRGTLRGGGRAEYNAVHIFTVRDGKIVRFREYVDCDQAITR
jgi:uncharacterized protein